MRPAFGRALRLRVAALQTPRSAGLAARARSRPLSSAASGVDVVVCGAGVVGVACAHYLAVRGAAPPPPCIAPTLVPLTPTGRSSTLGEFIISGLCDCVRYCVSREYSPCNDQTPA